MDAATLKPHPVLLAIELELRLRGVQHESIAWRSTRRQRGCCVSQSQKTGKLHSTFTEQFFPVVVGDLFKERCLSRVSAEEPTRNSAGGYGRLEFLCIQRARASCGEDLSQHVNNRDRVQNEERGGGGGDAMIPSTVSSSHASVRSSAE